jgi:Transposase and inactivated derivatives
LAFRAGIILGCATGSNDKEVAKQLRTTNWTVGFWRKRFNRGRLEALYDEPRVGAPRSISDQRVEEVITKTLESIPKNATHWSTRGLAQQLGMSQSSISRIWRAFGLQPHRSKSFSLSQDPQLIEKVRDIVGLYMEPPVNAVVLCVDEKGQIQALQRSQPLLPLRPGQVERRTHDYMRHGTTSLFAALEVATGNVLTKCYRRHRSVEFRDFLDQIDAVCLKTERFMSCWITTPPTRPRSCVAGWPNGRATTCTLPQPTVRGSIRSSAGLPNSVKSRSSEAIITRSNNSRRPSKPLLRT